VTIEVAKENLLDMINKGYFTDAYIDSDRNCLVFVQNSSLIPDKASPVIQQAKSNSGEYVAIVCQGCGATNKVLKDSVGECEYCGTPVSGK